MGACAVAVQRCRTVVLLRRAGHTATPASPGGGGLTALTDFDGVVKVGVNLSTSQLSGVQRMSSRILLAALALAASASAQAAVSVNSTSFTYSQSFDTLAATGSTAFINESTLIGWSLFRTAGTSLAVTAGTGSSNAGGFYSFGAANAGERALGSVASGSTGTLNYAFALTNNSGSALNSFTLGYDGEQWRNGGVAAQHALTVQYGFGSSYASVSSWVSAGTAFDFTSVVGSTTSAAVDGNVAGRVAGLGGTIATNWAVGDTLWVRWTDVDNTGGDHGLAIDNVSFSVTAAAVPEPTSYALLLAGLGAVGFIARRRRG